MSKKIITLALAVLSAAMFAFPVAAAAQEIHFEPGNGEAFTISGSGGELRAESEPTITCESTDGNGKFDAGSSTTGTFTLHITGCHTTVFGITAKCRTAGSSLDNTIHAAGTFHLIKWTADGVHFFPGTLITLTLFRVTCAGISSITVTGNLIGTITSPACGASSKTLSTSVTATGTTQNHLTYTGVNYDLKAYTGESVANEKTAALVGTDTATFAKEQKLVCT